MSEYLEIEGTVLEGVDNSVKESLSSIIIPKGITEIGNFAFWGCKSLEEISIPDSVKKI